MRKIGELKGKPIIEGNPNEIKKNQIHYKESDGNITLSERKEDNTLSSVTSGSGSGEGVKEYYYKVLDNIFNNDVILKLLSTYTIDSIIVPIEVYGDHTIAGDVNVSFSNLMLEFIKPTGDIKGIKLLDNFDGFWNYLDWSANGKFNKYEKTGKGNIITKVLSLDPENTSQEEINQMIEHINACLQEITKEEYEAMITYKPE